MSAAQLLEPKDITITSQAGEERHYTISKFDAISGREIVAKYPIAQLPKIGDYNVSEETMFKLMKFVAVDAGGQLLKLENSVLIKNHVPDWEVLVQIERAMLAYNCSFFSNGKGLTSLAELFRKGAEKISEISMASLAQLLTQIKQPSTNSEQSTP